MGLDLDALWGRAKEAVDTGMSDLLKSGGNAAIGYLEQQAINVISQDQSKHVADSQAATQAIMSRPSSANSFGAYMQGVLQTPILKQYGSTAMIAVVAIGVAAIFIYKK